MKRTFLILALLSVSVLSVLTNTGAATQRGHSSFNWDGMHIEKVDLEYALSTDSVCVAKLPAIWGTPSGILCWSWHDDDLGAVAGTAGKAKAAYAAGEVLYASTDEFCETAEDEYAGSSAGNWSVYRVDITDGTSTFQDSVVGEVFVFYDLTDTAW